MTIEVKVPALPESVSDGTLVNWKKQPGQAVRRGENLVDLETDKVVLDIPAPADGVLGQILRQEGDIVTTGDVIKITPDAATSCEVNVQSFDMFQVIIHAACGKA